ncbi:hypothetical protein SpCBS45565_g00340 [Spizellomyces sp. 'palustris']|nr:hypothetical protein SpCBS45565_g00340 [Spizellomyces sp. 'palustris']
MANVTYESVPYFVTGKEGSKAGVIVIQEWWGLNEQTKKTTQRYADALGSLAISPDLYRGKVATEADEANHCMSSLDWSRAIEDIKNAVKFLKSKGAEKVGITGFCMGGALTLASSINVPDLAAGVVFYGVPENADPKQVKIPLQFHFGDKDESKGFSDKETADKLKAGLKEAGKDVSEFYQYPDADHAFMNEEAPAYPYNPEAAKLAFDRSISFFKKHLR